MLSLTASDIASITGGKLVSGHKETRIESISLDTRTLKERDFFIPLKGERYDAHHFINDALKAGASGFFTERWNEKIKGPLEENLGSETVIIKVKDTLRALHDLASHVRDRLDVEVVGITGSTGKTCTKDILASILSQELRVIYTEKNYNNEIGVPLTLLKADEETEVVVIEMAMRGLGQIRELAEIAHPTLGLVTNVGKTHFEFLGSEELIAQAKGELVQAIPQGGLVVLNEDDSWTRKLRKLAPTRVVTYGVSDSADVRATEIAVDHWGRASFRILSPEDSIHVTLPFPGRHNVYNALAAYAVAMELGISPSNIKRGLERAVLSEMRLEVFTTPDGITILNDAYNANPTSMRAALTTLGDIDDGSRKVAVLGDMLELGKLVDISHFEVGEWVKDAGVDLLITVGEKSRRIAEGAIRKGMDANAVFSCHDVDEASRILKDVMKPGDLILIKASRGVKLEEVVNSLL